MHASRHYSYFNDGSLLYCSGANHLSRQFQERITSLEKGSNEWEEFITAAIDDRSSVVRILAFGEIGRSGGCRWLETLYCRATYEHDATILSAIYNTIVNIGGYAALEEKVKLLTDPSVSRRSAALVILDSLQPDDAIGLLCDMLDNDPEASLRKEAAKRLAYYGSEAGLQELLDSLENDESHIRCDAACALAALGNADGVKYVHTLLAQWSTLQPPERSNLVYSLAKCLQKCGIQSDQRGMQGDDPETSIIGTASEWIESKLLDVNAGDSV